MGGKRRRASPGSGEEEQPEVCEYEQERQANILKNEKRMAELGLLDSCQAFGRAGRPKKAQRPAKRPATPPPTRRSSRLQGAPVPTYRELSERDINGGGNSGSGVSKREIPEGTKPEFYTDQDEKLLGSYQEAWELFVDGFGPDGKRVYDPVRGKTCHQCRQKTMGLRTWCSQCKALHGQFCGDCLFIRYGENVREALQNKQWVCPVCRGICNCSFCRPKRGWPPTGCLYKVAVREGYKSVAHYLMRTRRAPPPPPPKQECEGKPKAVDAAASSAASTRRSLNFPVADRLLSRR